MRWVEIETCFALLALLSLKNSDKPSLTPPLLPPGEGHALPSQLYIWPPPGEGRVRETQPGRGIKGEGASPKLEEIFET